MTKSPMSLVSRRILSVCCGGGVRTPSGKSQGAIGFLSGQIGSRDKRSVRLSTNGYKYVVRTPHDVFFWIRTWFPMLFGNGILLLQNNAMACDFQQCGILTCVDSNEPVQSPFKLTNSKWYSVSSLTIIEYLSD